MKLLIQGAVAFLLAGTPVWAGLSWEKKVVALDAKPGEKVITIHYPFENKGSAPVTIEKVKPSCGCTTIKLDKTVYQPGEKGEVVAFFDVGKRKGTQNKKITVTTGDKEKETLIFTVELPEK